jgi:hypothetical protein
MTTKDLTKDIVFRKVLAKYYIKWFNDCCDSVVYCRERGAGSDTENEARAQEYIQNAHKYLTIIMENWEAIEFFSADDKRAFVYPETLPVEFRGYE